MDDVKKKKEQEQAPLEPGTGALCPESQADGVPCEELGRDCEDCENAAPRPAPEPRKPSRGKA